MLTLPEILLRKTAAQPDKPAFIYLRDGDAELERLSYGGLQHTASSVAQRLQSEGLVGSRALLINSQGPSFVNAFFGCLYAGVTAVPTYPPQDTRKAKRLLAILKDSEAKAILTDAASSGRITELLTAHPDAVKPLVVVVDEIPQNVNGSWVAPEVSADAVALLQYTSGSTGDPKGVAVTHANLMSNASAIHHGFRDTEKSVGVSWLPPYHDMGLIGGILHPVYVGATMVLMSPTAFIQKPVRWLQAISRYGATTSGGPNFAYDLCVRSVTEDQKRSLDLRSWSLAFSGAEPVRAETLDRFATAFESCGFERRSFYPAYGMAETTLMVSGGMRGAALSAREVNGKALREGRILGADDSEASAKAAVVSCGRVAPEHTVRIVDPDKLNVVPDGRVGEIWVAGPSVAQGYWNREAETKLTFRAYTANTREGPFLRTGDLGFLSDGQLYVTGRFKDLIIVRGSKHHPEEIEQSVQQCHPALRANGGAAIAIEVDGEERLVIVQEVERNFLRRLDAAEVVDRIRGTVSRLHQLDVHSVVLIRPMSLPKTPSGKIMRFACRESCLAGALSVVAEAGPGKAPGDAVPTGSDASPAERIGAIEAYLHELLEVVLEKRLNPGDRPKALTTLGLDSLRAIQFSAKVDDAFRVEVPLRKLFEDASISSLAAWITAILRDRISEPSVDAGVPDLKIGPDHQAGQPFPLTEMQEAYVAGRSALFALGDVSIHGYVELRGAALDVEALEVAWNALIRRHPMLRAVLLHNGAQRILDEVPVYRIKATDLRGMNAQAADAILEDARRRMSHHVLPLQQWPAAFDIQVFRLDEETCQINISIDGTFIDFRSRLILLRELAGRYAAPGAGAEPLAVTFRDYVLTCQAFRNSPLVRRSLEHWKRRLPSLPPGPELPLARRPEELSETRFVRRSFEIRGKRWSRLTKCCEDRQLTPASLFLAAYAEVLGAWSASRDFSINVPLYNRLPVHPQISDVVGNFSTFTLVAVGGPPEGTVLSRALHLQSEMMQGIQFRHAGGVRILRELFQSTGKVSPGLMPVVYTYAPAGISEGENQSWRSIERSLGTVTFGLSQTPQVWIDCQVWPKGDHVAVNWDSVDGLFPEGVLDDMFEAFTQLVARMAGEQQVWSEQTLQLAPARQLAVRQRVNETVAPLPNDLLLHTSFLRHSRAQGDRPAVISGDRMISYGELARAASLLTTEIVQSSPEPNGTVAILLEKGWEQIVAVLASSMSGRAYIPLDPSAPDGRRRISLEGSGAMTVIVRPERVGEVSVPCQCLALDARILKRAAVPVPDVGVDQAGLAYVIFTSGSTGIPKGVMITHRGAVNTIVDINQRFQVDPADRVLALSSLSFDLSVYDIFGLLGAGGAVVIPDADRTKDPAHWRDLVTRHGITIFNSVPAAAELFVEYLEQSQREWPPSLRLVMLSGDRIPLALPKRIRALSKDAAIHSLGGATEASIWSVEFPIKDIDPAWRTIPYGTPLTNQTLHVFKHDNVDAPDWVTGDIFIGGAGVASGYWKNPVATAAQFREHPRTRSRLYRTGDRGRYLPDGNIEILGREDLQVKVRGYRVELGEIDAVLGRNDEVESTATILYQEDGHASRLVAFVVPRGKSLLNTSALDDASNGAAAEPQGEVSPGVIRKMELQARLLDFAKARLPDYMVPSAYVLLDRMPLSANGKVNRVALGRWTVPRANPAGGGDPPVTDMEKIIAGVIQEVLGIQGMGRKQNLLDLGTTSLQMVQMQNGLKKALGRELAGINIFKYNTTELLADYITREHTLKPI